MPARSNDPSRTHLALSIRQPYAELILRGIKTVEYRTRSTRIVGRRFLIYASLSTASLKAYSHDIVAESPPGWLMKLARQMRMFPDLDALPRGLIVGSAVIERIIPPGDSCEFYQWVLRDVKRLRSPRKPRGHPQPVWFKDAA